MPIEVDGVCPLLQVFDMPAALAFYRDTLGFAVVQSSGPGDTFDWGLLRLGDAWLMLNTAYEAPHRPAAPDPARIAAHQDTALYFGCADVDGVHAYLRERGLAVKEPVITSYGMKQLYVRDPDGYNLCFQRPV